MHDNGSWRAHQMTLPPTCLSHILACTAACWVVCIAAAEPAAAAMDTADFVPLNGGKKKKAKGRQQGLPMQQQSL